MKLSSIHKPTRKFAWITATALSAALALASCTKKEEAANTETGNATQSATNTTGGSDVPSGLKIEDVKTGDGTEAQEGKVVVVHYTGSFTDGKVFDTSKQEGRGPFEFQLGAGMVIRGWDMGVKGMKVGGVRKLTISPELAYGERGAGNVIPPNSTLNFEVELLEVK